MTLLKNISTYISSTAISLIMLVAAPVAADAKDSAEIKNDSVPLFNGIAVSVDLVGPMQWYSAITDNTRLRSA